MAENSQPTSKVMHQVPVPDTSTITLRLPKPNMQVMVLGLVAAITLFQMVSILNISNKLGTSGVKAVAPATTQTGSTGGGSGSGANVPQSMVGGC